MFFYVKEATRLPEVRLIYAQGDYQYALDCFAAAREWAKETGAETRDGLRAFINPPPSCRMPIVGEASSFMADLCRRLEHHR